MTTLNPITAARDAIVAAWTTHWSGSVPVLWHQNSATHVVPDITTPAWLHIEIEPHSEKRVAYGGGTRNNERVQRGFLTIRAFGLTGEGEDDMLALLDAAVGALRGRQIGDLGFIDDIFFSDRDRGEDGLWDHRTALISYHFRFRG